MIRMLWWLFVGYIVWKVIEVVIAPRQKPRQPPPPVDSKADADFKDVQEADYEDLTPKSSPPPPKTS